MSRYIHSHSQVPWEWTHNWGDYIVYIISSPPPHPQNFAWLLCDIIFSLPIKCDVVIILWHYIFIPTKFGMEITILLNSVFTPLMAGVDTLATDSANTVLSSPVLWRHQRVCQCSDIFPTCCVHWSKYSISQEICTRFCCALLCCC